MNPEERAFGSERIRNARRAALMRVAIVGAGGGILLTDDTRRRLNGDPAIEPQPALGLGEPYGATRLYRYVVR